MFAQTRGGKQRQNKYQQQNNRPVSQYFCYTGFSHSLTNFFPRLQTSSAHWTLKDYEAVHSSTSTTLSLLNDN